jgi:hypothetical protein
VAEITQNTCKYQFVKHTGIVMNIFAGSSPAIFRIFKSGLEAYNIKNAQKIA